MKTFRQYLKEMPRTTSVRRDHIQPQTDVKPTPKGKKLFGLGGPKNTASYERTKLGRGTNTHDFYTHADGGHEVRTKVYPDQFQQVIATDKSGKEQFRISGKGNSKDRTFKASFAASAPDRTMKYHELISHLVTKGHIKQWKSDSLHSRGSVETYRKLAAHPGLKVTHRHEGIFGVREKRVTAKNIDNFYGKEGHFTITKK